MEFNDLGIPFICHKEEKNLMIEDEGLGKLSNDDVYKMVTERIIEQIDKNGHLPWQRSHDGSKGKGKQYIPFAEMPVNYMTLKPYRGINAILLMEYPEAKKIDVTKDGKPTTITVTDWKPITDGRLFWLTFKQIKEAGGTLKKGSKSAIVVFYNWIFKYKDEKISEKKYKELIEKFGCLTKYRTKDCLYLDKIPFLKYYNVFNERDVEGIDFEAKRKELSEKNKEFLHDDQKILAAEMVLKYMPNPPKLIIKHLGSNEDPYYMSGRDYIVMPLKEQFVSLESWYGTCFHEYIHATAAPKRTNRINKPGFGGGSRWGDQQYALEELVAEIGAVFLNAESGIMLSELKNNAAYIKGWAKKVKKELKENHKAIFKAAGEAQKAADYILDRDEEGKPKFWAKYDQEVKNINPTPKPSLTPKGTAKDKKLAEKFYKTADSLTKFADKKYDELKYALNNTPKRMREYNKKKIDADIAYDKAAIYRALGMAIEKGTLPGILKNISPVKSKDHLYPFVKGLKSTGYYEVIRDNEPRFKQMNESSLSSYAKELGLKDSKDIERAYHELMKLSNGKERTEEEIKADEIQRLIDEVRFKKIAGFFPTPEKIAERMVYEADIKSNDKVLEPSAGIGSIADVIKKLHKSVDLSVIEIRIALREILKKKGYKLVGDDFLEHKKKYDKIIMNPPFEKLQDIEHVRHAYSLLKEGGRLVSIMSPSGFFNSQHKAKDFREWFEKKGGTKEDLPQGSFKDSFNPTGVNAVLVIINKKEKPKTDNETSEQELLELEAKAILILQMQNSEK